jgi:hypothetical protein
MASLVDFIAEVPSHISNVVPQSKLTEIYNKYTRVTRVILGCLLMSTLPTDSPDFLMLEKDMNILQFETGEAINPQTEVLVEEYKRQMLASNDKMTLAVLAKYSMMMSEEIFEEKEKIIKLLQDMPPLEQ